MTDRLEDVIASRIRYYRRQRDLTVEALAARCRELGSDELSPSSITNLERGAGRSRDARAPRRLTIGQWLVLSMALDVPPALLIVPMGQSDDDGVAVTTTHSVTAAGLLDVVTRGAVPKRPNGQPLVHDYAAWSQGRATLDSYQEFLRAAEGLRGAVDHVQLAEGEDPDEDLAGDRVVLAQWISRLVSATNSLASAGVQIPSLPRDWIVWLRADDRLLPSVQLTASVADPFWETSLGNPDELGSGRGTP